MTITGISDDPTMSPARRRAVERHADAMRDYLAAVDRWMDADDTDRAITSRLIADVHHAAAHMRRTREMVHLTESAEVMAVGVMAWWGGLVESLRPAIAGIVDALSEFAIALGLFADVGDHRPAIDPASRLRPVTPDRPRVAPAGAILYMAYDRPLMHTPPWGGRRGRGRASARRMARGP